MATLFLLLVGAAALRRSSMFQVDLMARQKGIRDWLGSKRYMVASDTTYWRVLPRMELAELREELQQANVLLRQHGHGTLRLPGGRTIRAAAVDGSVFGGRYASVMEILGAHAAVMDLEPCQGKGTELPASKALLKRVFARHGSGWVDIVLFDGLYMAEPILQLCRRELGTHVLIKTKELETLNLLKEAEEIFEAKELYGRQVERIDGADPVRGMAYQGWAARGFHHGKLPDELKVARMRVRMLKGPRKGATETFWIVTTDVTLTAQQMRELAHLRWSIENHTFRALNAAVDSKHVWVRGQQAARAFEALMLILMLSFTLVLAYHAHLDSERLWEDRRLRRIPLAYLAECWLVTLQTAAGLFAPEG
jgi:hypothetical protein